MVNHPNRRRPVAAAAPVPHDHDRDYLKFLVGIQQAFDDLTAKRPVLFIADAPSLFFTYLANLPADHRQVHACNTCAEFLDAFGRLCVVDDHGKLSSVVWDASFVPEFYKPSVAAMAKVIANTARVAVPFINNKVRWGFPVKGASKDRRHLWQHMSITAPNYASTSRALTPSQAVAEAKHKVENVVRALEEYTPEGLDMALRIFRDEHVDRSERFVGPTAWLRVLHNLSRHRDIRHNLIWRAVMTAPTGYCHPRASVIAPMLEGIAAGMGLNALRTRFNAMVSAERYQRPQAPPAAGNIAAAEKLVEKLGVRAAFARRFARLDEIEPLWLPPDSSDRQRPAASTGLFAGVKPKKGVGKIGPPPHSSMPSIMTWVKFATKLASATRICCRVGAVGPYAALTSVVDYDAPPIIKWDHPKSRNPIAWYTYLNDMPSSRWNLQANTWVEVTAVARTPNNWGPNPAPHLLDGVFFILHGAVDRDNDQSALFPEFLIEELHGARATIEAYSKATKLEGADQASACGLMIHKGRVAGVHVAALIDGLWSEYTFDRWD